MTKIIKRAPAIKSFLFNNSYITKVFIHSIKKIASQGQNKVFESLYNLRSIEVASEHPYLYAIDNCLLRKEDNSLVLGCYKSVIPQGVSTIKAEAFLNCGKLEHILIPNSVSKIEDFAFAGCYNLQAIELPDSVLEANDRILMYCQRLQKFSVGSGLSEIHFKLTDYSVFGGPDAYNNLEKIVVSADNPYYKSEGDCLIEKATNTIVLGCKNSIIPSTVKEIGDEAFSCIKMEEIVIPYGIEAIHYAAFAGSTIKKCILPSTVTELGEYAFARCNNLRLVELPRSLEEFERYVFYRANVDTLIVPAGNALYGSMGVWYNAGYQIPMGDIYRREDDGSLTPPPYYAEVRIEAVSILEDLLQSINLDEPFPSVEKKIREAIIERIQNTFSQGQSPWENNPFVIKQKAHIYLLKKLNKSLSIRAFAKDVKKDSLDIE